MNKVLIVDDMELIRRSMKRLKLWGETSDFIISGEAEDGKEALKKLETESFDLVITDIRMPIIDGIELVRKITERKLAGCVVLLSDYTEFNYARQGFVHGAFDYFGKPIDEEVLSKLLERVKQHLVEKKQEEDKLKKLEAIAVEKLETYYPASDVDRLIGLIEKGDTKAIEVSNDMVSKTGAAFQYDLAKTAVVINNAMREVMNITLSKNEWINAFMDIAPLRNIDLARYHDWEMLKTTVGEIIERLSSIMVKFSHSNESNETVRRLCRYVLDQIDDDISAKILAERLFISRPYLSDLFRQKTGMTLNEYLLAVRMERAKKLIQDGILKNYEIAERLGFKDVEYFSKLFKKYTGIPPAEFRHKKASNPILCSL